MKQSSIEEMLGELMAAHPGVQGCALVEAASGLVWHRRPEIEPHGIWEAAVEHWRLQKRLARHFDDLGPARAIVVYHGDAKFALLSCLSDPEVLLVCLAGHGNVDWAAWQRDVRELGARIRAAR